MRLFISAALSGKSITKKEVKQVIRLANNEKGDGTDNVSVEILELLGKSRIYVLTDAFNIV